MGEVHNFPNFSSSHIPTELKLKHIYSNFVFLTKISQIWNGLDLGNIFPSNPQSLIYPWNSDDILTRSHFLAITEVNIKVNPGKWTQKKDIHLIHLANAAKQLLLEQWRNMWNSPPDVSFTIMIMADSSGRGSQTPHTWGRQKAEKHCEDLVVSWLLMITDQFVYELYISNTKEHAAACPGQMSWT